MGFGVHAVVSAQVSYAYTGGETSVSWSYGGNGAIAYDVEWVFIDDHDNFTGTASQAFSFKRAVRITTGALYYKHLTYYPQGRLWYRARAVGYNPQYPDHRINGQWFYGPGTALTIGNQQPDRNWQRQTMFSEDGQYKVTMNYFDGSLRQRQQQANLSSENLTLVGETLYDYEGRKSVDIMPVPSSDATLTYKSGFTIFRRRMRRSLRIRRLYVVSFITTTTAWKAAVFRTRLVREVLFIGQHVDGYKPELYSGWRGFFV